ncbi:SMI1/KNR4 family protein [Streptomyces sp. BE133]|uniref:SMI1/KNR4 family protein n=1 Tax=Streptomyces sp. BE133 TaxID=3002523 RepID=UPI002E76E1C3|nr:SMI1/KNR4 family protein [Streptomyces sp. BE133]MEE1806721.1 SMI1/KNR4 family protein [Streptomyces sp. BE133]
MSIESLEAALPGLVAQRLEVPRRIAWQVLFDGLRTGLPDDYIALAEFYPRLEIGQFLCVTSPAPGSEAEFVEEAREDIAVAEGMAQKEMFGGYPAFPESGGLLVWGASIDGDEFFWRTQGQPNEWTVVVAGRNDDWFPYEGSLSSYLAWLCSGTAEPHGLPPNFPGPEPVVSVG